MNPDGLIFAIVAGAGLLFAAMALISREIVHTIMWIAVFFVSLALLYFLLLSPFLGVLQLAVYAGAVTVLLLFAVMVVKKRIFSQEAVTGITAVSIFLTFAIGALLVANATGVNNPQPGQGYAIDDLSRSLFTQNGAWVIALGIVMMSALVGAVYLARESRGRHFRRWGQ